MVNSGTISSTALILSLEERKNDSSEAMSAAYELIYDCIKVSYH